MTDYTQIERKHEFDVYKKRDLVLVRGDNATVWDEKGNAYIDCVAGHGVINIGHANAVVSKTIQEQSQRLIHCSNLFYNDQRALLLEKLIQITPQTLSRAFLCNSGTEAVEAAIKFARFTTGRTDFICTEKAFHGRTLGALSATHKPEYREGFEPLVPGFSFVPFNDFDKLAEHVTSKTAGIILEVVQGEGGINVGEPEYFQQIRNLCDEKGLLLIIDEIQTGFCRTGRMFACEHFELQPDILCAAKAIAGGLPMGATVCSDKVTPPVGKHGTTFGGNPLSCAAAVAAIDFMLEHQLDTQAQEKGAYLIENLRNAALKKVKDIRGLGLMIGVELQGNVLPVISQLIEAGVLTFPAGATTIRVFPPLTISYEELDTVVNRLKSVLK